MLHTRIINDNTSAQCYRIELLFRAQKSVLTNPVPNPIIFTNIFYTRYMLISAITDYHQNLQSINKIITQCFREYGIHHFKYPHILNDISITLCVTCDNNLIYIQNF